MNTNQDKNPERFYIVNARLSFGEREQLRAGSERLGVPMSTLLREGAWREIQRLERERSGG